MSAETEETSEEPKGEETPEIEAEERADVDLDNLDIDTEAVEQEAGASSQENDESEESEETTEAPDEDQTDESGAQPELPDGESWGDQYVTMLALLLGEIAEAGDGPTDKDAGAIEDLARSPPVELNDAVDEWLAQSGMETDISPGKQVALGTAGLALVIILTETDVAQDAISDIADDMDLNL